MNKRISRVSAVEIEVSDGKSTSTCAIACCCCVTPRLYLEGPEGEEEGEEEEEEDGTAKSRRTRKQTWTTCASPSTCPWHILDTYLMLYRPGMHKQSTDIRPWPVHSRTGTDRSGGGAQLELSTEIMRRSPRVTCAARVRRLLSVLRCPCAAP